jgi:hypothetical protein
MILFVCNYYGKGFGCSDIGFLDIGFLDKSTQSRLELEGAYGVNSFNYYQTRENSHLNFRTLLMFVSQEANSASRLPFLSTPQRS